MLTCNNLRALSIYVTESDRDYDSEAHGGAWGVAPF